MWANQVYKDCIQGGQTGTRPALLDETASATNPTLVPNFADPDTGIGRSAANVLNLIAGGVEVVRLNTVASAVNYLDVTPAAANGSVAVAPAGTDTDIALNVNSKGLDTIRVNSRTVTTTTADFIGFQCKPGIGVATAKNVIGAEISPRVNDTFALTGSGSAIGLHVDVYLKGTTGDIAGDVRNLQLELVDDTGSSRTVTGNVSHIRVRSNISYAVSGKYSVLRVENEEGTKALDALVQFTTGSGAIVESAGTVGGTQNQAIKILIGTTTYYVPLHTAVS